MKRFTASAMESGKPSLLKNFLVRLLLFGVLIFGVRFAYVVTVTGESCTVGNFCFFSLPENLSFVMSGAGGGASAVVASDAVPSSSAAGSLRRDLYTSKDWIKAANFYSSIFQDLISHGYLSPESKSLCVETPKGQDVFALKEIGVLDSVGIFKKASKPLVISGEAHRMPFKDNTFDFIFSGGGRLDKSPRPLDFASEIVRTLKPEGYAVVHIGAKDTYSFNSFLGLFNCCNLLTIRDIEGYDSSMPYIREMVLKKEYVFLSHGIQKPHGDSGNNKCSVPGYKQYLVRKAEPLIKEEPLKPWITLKRNMQNVKYLPSMADISFKNRYVYVDVGARSYGSSIGSWFKKQYPKQNKTFQVYAIEADKTFHEEYEKKKKQVTLLPFAAWVKNETLSFEINRDPGDKVTDKGRGMGRIQPGKGKIQQVNSKGGFDGEVDKIQGFDFANWLKNTVTEKDFVVMKMDVEGTEFDLIPRLFETGAICLIDEIFLECHYNRWQRCCPGQRSEKYEKTYGQCLELFTELRQGGVLVHQWW
ncbi:Methyltransferase FkbM [Parasponia andersonii]|uniref:Methyltransferase FkbM n=1 Tax=Parasponia andersonii TaxID=3476 RepID=A0A2P5BXT7_PARAD|nr:Methyltransferase FkbM [Parasponia andersonii]